MNNRVTSSKPSDTKLSAVEPDHKIHECNFVSVFPLNQKYEGRGWVIYFARGSVIYFVEAPRWGKEGLK